MKLPKLPDPVAHVHSNRALCYDKQVSSKEWPVYFFTAAQVETIRLEAVKAALDEAVRVCEQHDKDRHASETKWWITTDNIKAPELECAAAIRAIKVEG